MELRKAILVCIRKAPEKATRTVVQKLLYLAVLKELTKAPYEAHYYGPYSSEVASLLEDLSSSGLIEETEDTWQSFGSPWEIRRYRYSLPEGVDTALDSMTTKEDLIEARDLESIIETCERKGSLNPRSLSIAAKVLYILYENNRPLTEAEIADEARKIGWKLTESEIQVTLVDLLAELGLVASKTDQTER